jgi:hypothetical protein
MLKGEVTGDVMDGSTVVLVAMVVSMCGGMPVVGRWALLRRPTRRRRPG